MNGVGADVARVLAGVEAAQEAGLPIKINSVIKKSVNQQEVLPLATFARENGIHLRFIEFMDVGETNQWSLKEVLPAHEIVELLDQEYGVIPELRPEGAVAEEFLYRDGRGKVGIIRSVSQPFCHDCTRLRLSAQGKLYGCLFASSGTDLKGTLRAGATTSDLEGLLRGFWSRRTDRYSELRGKVTQKKIEMSYIGG